MSINFGMKKTESTCVFIDGQNLYATARALQVEVDYRKMHKFFEEQTDLTRIYYYSSILETDDNEHIAIRPLIDWLDYNGFFVVTKQAKEFTDSEGRRKIKGSMGMEMAVDMMEMANHCKHIFLFSGDGDFRCVVDGVQRHGTKVSCVSTLATQTPMISDDLRRQVDNFVELMDIIPMIGREPRQARGILSSSAEATVRPAARTYVSR